MKFSCATSDFARAAGIAERFCGKNIALPVLAQVLIEADGDIVSVTGTNLEHAVVWRVPARVSRNGKVCVPARTLSSLLQSFGDQEVRVEEENGSLRLAVKERDGKVNGMPADEFPLVPTVKKMQSFTVNAGVFSQNLARILPAVSASEFKPELTGVSLRVDADTMTLAATDTFRLGECGITDKSLGSKEAVSCIIPERTATEMMRILDGQTGKVTVSLGENQLLVECDDGKIISRLIDGNFPDYRAIIPAQFSTSAYVKKNDLIAAIRSASIFASKLQEVTLRFSPTGLEIAASNPDVGEYRTTCQAALTGKEISMSFNWRYIMDGIQALDDEEIFFGCNKESSPALMRNKSHQAYTYVVMPIRLT